MTVRGSVAAISAVDDAWDDQAEIEFLRFLPVVLEEVLAASAPGPMSEAICRGAEELVYGVDARIDASDPVRLSTRLLDDPGRLNGTVDQAIWALEFHPGQVGLRLPLTAHGLALGDLVVVAAPGRWISLQERMQLRRFAELVAPMMHDCLANAALRQAALTDQLTGLSNRRALDRELDRMCTERRGVCLLLLDIDGLKDVNDTLGYEQGDHLICALAAALRETVGEGPVIARMGGDEFVVLVPESTAKKVRKLGRKVRRALARQPLPPGVAALSGGVSVGVVEGRAGETPRQLLRRAARSMRSQKRRRSSDRR